MPRAVTYLACYLFVFLLAGTLARAQVLLNEIHYAPDVKTEAAEFVELFNGGVQAVNLSGWRLDDGVSFLFPNGTSIPAGGYLAVAQDPAVIATKYGATALGPWTGRLDNSGERVRLVNAAGGVVDEVEYKLGFPWPTVGAPPGYSIELINPAFDNDLGGNWRPSVVSGSPTGSRVLLPRGSTWRYFKGQSEPSNPVSAWRQTAFNDSSWSVGPAPIGYDPSVKMGTTLQDMRYNYTTVYLRTAFQVDDPGAIGSLSLRAMYDDGFKIWVNGVAVRDGAFGMAAGEQPYTAVSSGAARESAEYVEFDLGSPASFLVKGQNVIAVQAANVSKDNSSDFYIDLEITANLGGVRQGPTPGARNAAFATNAPPQVRQVSHSPKQPASSEAVRITAKITDPDGVGPVLLFYQPVQPGSYIELTDIPYTNSWTSIAMNDAGQGGDLYAGDSIYTATIPASLQQHRHLIRYRIRATDGAGLSVQAPYPDDPVPNFAYFCYDGIPAWQAAVRPGSTPVVNFSPQVMRHLPAIHLISKKDEVEQATWFNRYGGDAYPWTGTIVYDGEVYDHVNFRARGGVWRYAMVKNMWKFDFHRGHDFQMRDDYGREYKTSWTKLNLGASIQQGDYDHRGEQGMFESVGFRLFNLAGVESPRTTFVQLRIVDQALEADPATQYEGDFWGVYLVVEQEDGRFLDEHNLPDGNFYKMESGTGELNNLGFAGPANKSDLNTFLNTYRNSSSAPSESWWRANMNLENYYSYQAIVQGIHHYDICYDKNYFYYRNPETALWSVHTWDLDLTWANNMYDSGCGGIDDLYAPVFGTSGYPARPAFNLEYRNRVREIRNLLFNTDQAWQVIDEHARLLRGTNSGPTILDADRSMWDYNPKMTSGTYSSSLNKAGQGRFYQWPREPGVSKDFNGAIQLMKDYVVARSALLDNLANDSAIPARPAITYAGEPGFPANKLQFRASSYSGTYPFAAMQWRMGEISDPAAPAFVPGAPSSYEITAVWESPVLTSYAAEIAIPPAIVKVGHAYRARVRMKDTSGRWSHWSEPVQFIAGLPDNASSLVENLRVTELMYDPPAGSAYEFIELRNINSGVALDLSGATFTSGIDFTFPSGTSIPPGGYLLLHRASDTAGFRSYYGLDAAVALAGPYSGALDNQGEQLTLKTGAAGLTIFSFDFAGSRSWPVAAGGAGHSLVPLGRAVAGQGTGALDYPGNWRASAYLNGSPGRLDSEPPSGFLVLNEVAAHTDYSNPQKPEYDSNDWVELFNPGGGAVQLAGYFLSDDPADLRKYALSAGSLPTGAHLALDEVTHFHSPITSGFGIDKAGERVLLSRLNGTAEDRVVDAVAFKGQENNFTLSRYPDGASWWFATLPTRGAPNSAPVTRVVISEVMYRPPDVNSTDNVTNEFIEVFNPTSASVSLSDTNGPWRLDGGVGFTFPVGTVLDPGAVLLLVNFDPSNPGLLSAFRSTYGITNGAVQVLGPFSGKLGNRSDRVAIEKPQYPDSPGGSYSWVIVDEVVYGNQDPWPTSPNGTGLSLHRLNPVSSGNDPGAWTAAEPTPGTAPTFVALDADGDGIPDSWEVQNGLDPSNPADAMADFDQDGMNNLSEYLSGTDPRDPSSALQFDAVTDLSGTVTLTFTALANRTYSILYRGTADAGPWLTLSTVPAEGGNRKVTVADTNAIAFQARYYRLVTPGLE